MFALNKFGLYLLFLLLTIIPFHHKASDFGLSSYYREMIAVGFLILLSFNLLNQKPFSLKVRKEIFYLILFPFLLCLSALYDPMGVLYKYGGSVNDITNVTINIEPRLYILRNALLYLPMILYFATRGITEEEVNKIAILSLAVAPFSIIIYLVSVLKSGNFSIFLLGEMSENSGIVIEYNSYVPYLSFPVISGIYLLSGKYNSVLKLLIGVIIAFVSIFIFLSTSRQTILLIFISWFLFFTIHKSSKNYKKIIILFIAVIISVSTFEFIMSNYKMNDKIVKKYTTDLNSNIRVAVMLEGIKILEPHEYLTGAGLSSVIVSGPHNDYVRWTQRVGLLFMIISFIPYYSVAFKCFLKTRHDRNDLITLYIGVATFFIIYHSFFGYPREDAYQAVWSFLGITIWLGYTKHNSNTTLLHNEVHMVLR